MGCNTSKESVPAENQENQETKREEQKNDGTNEPELENAVENHAGDSSEVKSPSARTITLRPKSTSSAKSNESDKHKETKQRLNSTDRKDLTASPEAFKEEEEAATKIQAVFRGHKTRKSMKQPASSGGKQEAAEQEPTRQQLEEEFRADDKELCEAATKIQASFRGHMTRKNENVKKEPGEESNSKQDANNEEELDIDLSDPDLNKAAVKIQASFRGHMVRKENDGQSQVSN